MYIYGRPQYLAEIITVRSYKEWHGEHAVDLNTQLKNNKSSLKGYFVANLYLGDGRMFKVDTTWKGVDFAVKKLIAACFCDYMAVKNAFASSLSEPTAEGIKRDIHELIFDRYNSSDVKAYGLFFDKNYEFIIKNIRNAVVDNWNGKEPSEEVKKFFTDSYTYKKRKTTSKWSWMKDMKVMEIAKKLISTGIDKLSGAIISAMKHLHISVKNVIEALETLMNKLGDDAKQEVSDNNTKHEWFTSLTDRQKDQIVNFVKTAAEWNYDNLKITLITCFKAPECIFKQDNYFWGRTVDEYYNRVIETENNAA